MKTTEQKQREIEMKITREAFRKLWLDQLTWIAVELGVKATPDIEHIAWHAFLGGIAKQKISENSCCKVS
jgi:hypothetical protein